MEDEDSIAALLDFEVWFVPRSSGGESGHAHASASHQEPSGQPEGGRGDQQPQQQSTEGAQPSQVNEEAPPTGRRARGKQRGGRARGGRSSSAGRRPASKKGGEAADAEEEGEGPSKRARTERATPAANQGPTAPGTVVVPTLKFALCARSRVLRPILVACKNQSKLEVPYDNQEHLEAGKLVVHLLHDLAVPADLKKLDWDAMPPAPGLAVRMCQWAIYWDAPEAAELCLDRLSCCELDVLTAADIRSILDLPSAVITMPQFAKAKKRCAAWLLRSYSDVPRIITDDGLRASFCSELSFAAVALWAAQDGLTVRSENEVAVLLFFWYDAQESSVSDKEAAELSGPVRVGQMSQSFRHFVLPKLAWFRPSILLSSFNIIYDDGGVPAVAVLAGKLPPAWVAPAKRGRPVPGNAMLTFSFSQADLASMLAHVDATEGFGELCTSPQFFSGYFFCLVLELGPDGALSTFLCLSSHGLVPPPAALKRVFVSARSSRWECGLFEGSAHSLD